MHVAARAARAHLRRTPGRARNNKNVPDRNEGVDFAAIVELSPAGGGGKKKICTSVVGLRTEIKSTVMDTGGRGYSGLDFEEPSLMIWPQVTRMCPSYQSLESEVPLDHG
jgi:hypothetical protein